MTVRKVPALILGVVVLLLTTSTASVGAAGSSTSVNGWSSPVNIDGSNTISFVSCVSSTFCMAADNNGNLLHFDGTTWTSTNLFSGQVANVSCASSSFCIADALNSNQPYQWNGSSWNPTPTTGGAGLGAVSCPTTSFCMVGGSGSSNVDTFNGSTWSEVTSPLSGVDFISCISSLDCGAANYGGQEARYNGVSWGPATTITNGDTITGLSCAAGMSFGCVATGISGTLYLGSSSIPNFAPTPIFGVSCTAIGGQLCMVTAGSSIYQGSTGSVVDPGNTLWGVSCPSASFCMAGDSSGNELTYTGSSTPAPLSISTSSLPAAQVGQAYNGVISASGGNGPYSWTITNGIPPTGTGLTTSGPDAAVSGVPIAAGSSTVTVTVTDSSNPVQSASFTGSIAVEPQFPPQTLSGAGSLVMNQPHVAFVLVGSWWCGLLSGSLPSACSSYNSAKPPLCKLSLAPKTKGVPCSIEASYIMAGLNALIQKDYSDSSPNGYDVGLAQLVGQGVQERYSNGTIFAGPVSPGSITGLIKVGPPRQKTIVEKLVTTLNGFAGGFGIGSQSDVSNTVFVLLYAPNLYTYGCANPSTNGPTGGGATGIFGSFQVANVYLEDYNHNCSTDLNESAPLPISAEQFATYAVSHELDEAITNPANNTGGWSIGGHQIADDCHTRNLPGQTSYTAYPYPNLTRDELGTVVSAYVNPLSGECFPGVDTGIPPA